MSWPSYCQLCAALVRGGLVLECVINDDLAASLRRNPAFVEFDEGRFFLRKESWEAWPLSLP